MKKIEHEVKIQGDIQTVYQALTTLHGLESWHSAHMKGEPTLNGEITMLHKKNPVFSWKIIGLKPNHSVEWKCVQGPNNAPGTLVCFNLIPGNDGKVLVECTHQGWSETDAHFRKCNTLWGMLLFHLKQFIESGNPKPAFH